MTRAQASGAVLAAWTVWSCTPSRIARHKTSRYSVPDLESDHSAHRLPAPKSPDDKVPEPLPEVDPRQIQPASAGSQVYESNCWHDSR